MSYALPVACAAALLTLMVTTRLRNVRAGVLAGGAAFGVVYVAAVLIVLPLRRSQNGQNGPNGRASEQPTSKLQLARHTPAQVLADGYVSSHACQECHPNNHASWHASYHHTMTQPATPETVFGDFDNSHVEFDGRSYSLERRGAEFWVKMHDPDNPVVGDDTLIERPITLVTGSHHMQIYWYATSNSRALGQLPVHYHKEEQKWIPADASLITPPKPPGTPFASQTSRWNILCSSCHATHPRPRTIINQGEIVGYDTQVAEFGISCEACHGPAAAHVRFRSTQAGQDDVRSGEDPIVNPARLPHQKSSDVCGLCHSFSIPLTVEREQREIEAGYDFRPGDALSTTRLVVRRDEATRRFLLENGGTDVRRYMDERFWSDGVVRVAGREYTGMTGSKCFTHGDISCVSCHEMHPDQDDPRPLSEWANDQLKPEAEGDQACVDCHQATQYQTAEHTHHAADSAGSRCYNCHMPFTNYGLMKAMRSHHIERPNVTTSVKTGRPNGCNLCHLDKSYAWTADHLADWYGTPKPELTPDQQSVSAAALTLLTGDPGQRAIMAWNFGWEPARTASGEHWMAPYLATVLEDPYPVVRLVAYRSLRQYAGFEKLAYDYVGSAEQRKAGAGQVLDTWEKMSIHRKSDSAVLIGDDGKLLRDAFERLRKLRNDRPLNLLE